MFTRYSEHVTNFYRLLLNISGHLRYDYVIKYAYFVKCYLERFASISDPEKWTTNVAQRRKHVKRDFK